MPDDGLPFPETTHALALDPEVLARELAQELLGDPLDEIDSVAPSSSDVAAECDLGIELLKGGREERLQGLRIFCEHRDPRAIPLLLPLLKAGCPIVRMSAVYALGRNPHPLAVEPLLGLLAADDNGYVRKAVAWSLGNYPEAPVLNPLIRALELDIAAVRLWAASSLADAGATGVAKADPAAAQLLLSLRIDSEPAVRSNCAWSLGRLYTDLVEPRQRDVVEALLHTMLHDGDPTVRDEARMALEQLEQPEVLERLQTLVDEGLIS
ncbi:HEAT repeat domain-containing protein [Cyanobium sp. N.Huapi 1H5]|jgi:HEAT repeat protein|uniref:HEAT repeat domain-containing protein n=1 Tax=Synechococcales TaxID=1890424 RepID=UPI001689E964|nr:MULTISPECIES: HEAT repeat domain-containing protein [Synechococcales]MBD2718776.1 HEAT repeat domain-containing protein [Synechococcus sp. FACHB-909]MBM5821139.1 HEAT repeat domain-containing protein [Cyanobacteria bacterium K_Offshore_surface_m2_011]MCP9838048.1 HEAT repeat domain-containing protein [Cyanobium sp. N.Huapi 1H5]